MDKSVLIRVVLLHNSWCQLCVAWPYMSLWVLWIRDKAFWNYVCWCLYCMGVKIRNVFLKGNWSPSDFPTGSSFPPYGHSGWHSVNRNFLVVLQSRLIVDDFYAVFTEDWKRGTDWAPRHQWSIGLDNPLQFVVLILQLYWITHCNYIENIFRNALM